MIDPNPILGTVDKGPDWSGADRRSAASRGEEHRRKRIARGRGHHAEVAAWEWEDGTGHESCLSRTYY